MRYLIILIIGFQSVSYAEEVKTETEAVPAAEAPVENQPVAQSTVTKPEPLPDTYLDKRRFQLGYRYGYSDTAENDNHVQGGFLHGVFTKFAIRAGKSIFLFATEAEGLVGVSQFQGQTHQGEAVSAQAKESYSTLKVATYLLFNKEKISFRPYAGLGATQKSSQLTIPGGYTRTATLGYLFGGAELRKNVSQSIMLQAAAEYEYLAGGKVNTSWNRNDEPLPAVENNIKQGYGARVTAGAHFWTDKRINLLVQAYHQYWNLAASDTQTIAGYLSYSRPASVSSVTGMSVGANF